MFYAGQIAPLRAKKLSTVPIGVQTSDNQPIDSGPSSIQAPTTILATAVVSQAMVSRSFEQAASIRLDIVDKNHNVIEDGTSVTVTLTSSSPTAKFDSGPAALISAGRLSKTVNYTDTVSGKSTITAFVSGLISGSATIILSPGPAAGLSDITPIIHSPQVGQTTTYRVSLLDGFGNVAAIGQVGWELADAATSAVLDKQIITTNENGSSHYGFTPTESTINRKLTLMASYLARKQSVLVTPVR